MTPPRIAAGFLAVLGLYLLTPAQAAEPADADLKAILDPDVKFVLDNLKGGSPAASNKRAMGAAQTALLVIAKTAEPKNPGIRDAALKAFEAIGKRDYKTADAAVKGIADAKEGSAKKVDWSAFKKYDINSVMAAYRKVPLGLGLEEKVKEFGKEGGDPKEMAVVLAHVAVINDLSDHYTPEFTVAKPKAEWVRFNEATKKAVADAQAALKGGKEKELKTAFTKLDGACTGCHNTFKN